MDIDSVRLFIHDQIQLRAHLRSACQAYLYEMARQMRGSLTVDWLIGQYKNSMTRVSEGEAS